MQTLLNFGPRDHGRLVSRDECESATWEAGYQYEVIDGRLYVSLVPNRPWNQLEMWLLFALHAYAQQHPEVLGYVATKTKVRLPQSAEETAPEPDVAAYEHIPDLGDESTGDGWEGVSPLLVGEVLSPNDPDKDLVRNVELYEQVPEIKEYWIVDTRDSVRQPSLIVYRRRGRCWRKPRVVPFGGTYETPLLPGFKLVVDPY